MFGSRSQESWGGTSTNWGQWIRFRYWRIKKCVTRMGIFLCRGFGWRTVVCGFGWWVAHWRGRDRGSDLDDGWVLCDSSLLESYCKAVFVFSICSAYVTQKPVIAKQWSCMSPIRSCALLTKWNTEIWRSVVTADGEIELRTRKI